jgi:hypothetical protein
MDKTAPIDAFPTVYFCCPLCAMVYSATQEHLAGGGLVFFCGDCGTPVHEWTGRYNFIKWTPVMKTKGHDRRWW